MALTPGTRLGPYEVTAQIGVGGMGEVYRATDTNLKRAVAIKVLPASVASDVERLARFQREAEVLAALNHPNIAAIYGLERSGGTTALVMELVLGPTLADRIAQGPIPVDEALPIAKQIAEALEAAHERGIIHRDLKPANVKVRLDGMVKVLDFGLAKALASASAVAIDATASPTITSPALMTGAGMILGTAAYMSPEQARGKAVDKRADIWAFGAVLFEMLTGERVFQGEDIADTIGAVIHKQPDWTRLPEATPPAVRVALQRCLEKDPRRRLRDVGDVQLALSGAFEMLVSTIANVESARTISPRQLLAAVAVSLVAAAALAGGSVWLALRLNRDPEPVGRYFLTAPSDIANPLPGSPSIAITSDGRRTVYIGNGGTQLFVRAHDALEPVAILTGRLIRDAFVSPDRQWIGCVDESTTLKKVSITGGSPITLARLDGGSQGATWLRDDTIVFATAAPTGLQRMSASGGAPSVLTTPDYAHGQADHIWPEALPDDRGVLFTMVGPTTDADARQVAVFDLRSNTTKLLVRGGSHAVYVPGGYLAYLAAGAIRVVAFDLERLEVRGTPVPMVTAPPATTLTGFAVAGDGTLVYATAPTTAASGLRTLVWVDRAGSETATDAPTRAYQYPSISPDGTRIAVSILDQDRDLWIWELRRKTLTRLTFDPTRDTTPVWTPDGRRLVFASDRERGVFNLWWQAADGTASAERLTTAPNVQFVSGVSADGRRAVYYEIGAPTGRDLKMVGLDRDRRVSPLLAADSDDYNGLVSPDGRWIAYQSAAAGEVNIYVRPFPTVESGQWQVSLGGGSQPLWARSGRELFFFDRHGALTVVPVDARVGSFSAGTPKPLLKPLYYFSGPIVGRTYDVTPDGQRFLMVKEAGADQGDARPQIIVVQHWTEELKRLVPTN